MDSDEESSRWSSKNNEGMAQYKLFGKDLKEYEDIDVDDLLTKLTPEEIEELGQELIDPDDSHIPPSQRCRYKTDKVATGPFNRKALIDFLEDKAMKEKDWEENKPYAKEVRGKIWKPKAEEKIQLDDDDAVATEWDEVLACATEEELVDLAAILGFHGMLNQVQYHQAFVEGKELIKEDESEDEDEDDDKPKKEKKAGFQGVAKHEGFKLVADEPPNDTNVDGSLKKIKENDPKLKEVNLNNIKNISLQVLCKFGDALKENTHLEKLHMANVRATDKVAKCIAEGLKKNRTLTSLNLESNYISGEGIKAILEAIKDTETVTEIKFANQRPQTLGVQNEQRIADLVSDNYKLMKLGIFLSVASARVQLQDALKRNNDSIRVNRIGGELPPRAPPKCVELPKSRRGRQDATSAPTTSTAASPPTQNGKAAEESEEEEDSDEEESDEE